MHRVCTVLVAVCAVGAFAQLGGFGPSVSLNCQEAYKTVKECFMDGMNDYADSVMTPSDFDDAKACMKAAGKACAEERVPAPFRSRFGGGAGGASGARDAAMQCKEELVPAAKEQMEQCVQEEFEWFEFPDVDRENAPSGVKLMAMARMAHQHGDKCPAVVDCLPVSPEEVKAEACRVQTECVRPYEEGLQQRCKQEMREQREAVAARVCVCFREQYGGEEGASRAVDTVGECMQRQGASLPTFARFFITRMVQQKMEQAEEKICGDDPLGERDFCSADSAESSEQGAQRDNANNGRRANNARRQNRRNRGN